MEKRTREIIALVLLVLLGIAAVCAMGWYILVGHRWNVTASNIDDSIGQMEGYTVLLVEGTRNPKPEDLESFDPGDVSDKSTETKAIDMDALIESYQEKGAEVYALAAFETGSYGEPLVVSRGNHRVGIAALAYPARPAAVAMARKQLAHQRSDFTVVFTNDEALTQSKNPGVDIFILDIPDEEPLSAQINHGSYWVSTPLEGEVEAIIVAPSGVISSKTLGQGESSSLEDLMVEESSSAAGKSSTAQI